MFTDAINNVSRGWNQSKKSNSYDGNQIHTYLWKARNTSSPASRQQQQKNQMWKTTRLIKVIKETTAKRIRLDRYTHELQNWQMDSRRDKQYLRPVPPLLHFNSLSLLSSPTLWDTTERNKTTTQAVNKLPKRYAKVYFLISGDKNSSSNNNNNIKSKNNKTSTGSTA